MAQRERGSEREGGGEAGKGGGTGGRGEAGEGGKGGTWRRSGFCLKSEPVPALSHTSKLWPKRDRRAPTGATASWGEEFQVPFYPMALL